jgi:molybdate transport system substrate-binding protein
MNRCLQQMRIPALMLAVATLCGCSSSGPDNSPTADAAQQPASAGQASDRAPLVVYCAAGMIRPMEAIARQYEREVGVPIQLDPGGSGKLLTQIRALPDQGHLYLAADQWYIDEARRLQLVAESIPVAHLHVVIAVPRGNPQRITKAEDLLRAGIRVALANPELASVGRLVQQSLEAAGLWQPLMEKKDREAASVSFLGTVNEAAQALRIDAADVALIWDALAHQYDLDIIDSPALESARSMVIIGVLSRCDRPTEALRFARYVTARDRGLPHFAEHRFNVVRDADRWAVTPEIDIMAGAMLKPGVEDAIRQFAQREGVRINTVYNGCGLLVSQMRAGAKPEVYISCDTKFLDMVRDQFEPETDLARNPIVIVVARGNPHKIATLEDLADRRLRVGLAHPVNSALGELTDRMLRKLNLRQHFYDNDDVLRDGALHADAGHTLINQMRTGSLDACIVYVSNARSADPQGQELEVIRIPLPEAIATQPLAVHRQSEHRYLMYRLRDWLVRPDTAQRFTSLGFEWIYRPQAGTESPGS